MQIPRIRATIVMEDGTCEIIDRVFESLTMAKDEYNRLVALQSTSKSGIVQAEICGHFGGDVEACEELYPTVQWGTMDNE
jgi:hypothetical protein